ncbi:MAG TPA: ribonucleotide reductase N-terminal alpha domain-containing protein [Methylomirabilota bacterium]|jgi:ribonucleoside-diphosphate reductase alpha chain|nr:ribonucleotide reductase N-terminal alpha domain-containing protein [Methylomirabilota bacterium]
MLSESRPAKVGKWTEPALRVLRERYLTRRDGEVVETPEEMCWRVAQSIAAGEARYGRSPAAVREIAEAFYDMMVDGYFLPNSPTLMNAGKGNGLQYSACYVLPVGDSMEEIFDSVKAAAIIHKCLVADTWVMSNGLTRLSEVPDGALVMTDEGPFHVSAWHDNGEQPVFEVRTNRGYRIVGTAEHRLLVVADDGSYGWRKIGELRGGDWLVMKPGPWICGETKLPEFEFAQKRGGNCTSFRATEYRLPRELTPALAELIGLYIGDGSNHRDGIRVTVSRECPEVVRRIEETSFALFGKRASISYDARKHTFEVAILSTQIKAWFDFLGVTKASAREAQIPPIILRSTEEVACAFVRGLFTADGCVRKNGHITLTTISPRLAEDLQSLLLALGVPTHLRKDVWASGYEVYQVSVCTKAGFRMFRRKIGFIAGRKAARLAAVDEDAIFVKGETIPNQRRRLRTWYDGLPADQRRQAKRLFDDLLNRVTAPRELSRQRITAALKGSGPFPSFFEELAKDDFFFVRVTAIRPAGIRRVYDLTVPEKHAYIANGFAAHNSGGGTGFAFSRLRPKDDIVTSTGGRASGPVSFLRVFNGATEAVKQGGTRRGANMGILRVDHPDILEFIECKLDGGITNFNISVAATNAFMEALEKGEDYDLINPRNGKPIGRLSAPEVFRRVVAAAWRTGDPGMVFIDRINASPANPTPEIGMIEATNPCVTGDTRVATPEGWRRADAVRAGGLILTVDGPRPVERVEINPNTPIFRVDFSDGGGLRVTASHQFHVYRQGAGFLPTRLDRCHVGDEVQTLHAGVFGAAKILRIEAVGVATTYDLYEPETDTWITEGYISRGCGEQPLLPNEACNLGSLNVSKFARRGADGEWSVDWEEMERVIRLAVRFLDDVIEMNPYPLPAIDATVKANRRIGLGIMGWADLLFILGIPYDSQEAINLAERLMSFVKDKAHDQSAKLAEERGPFPNWGDSIYRNVGPMRNSTVTTIAPTGTISMIAGCSSGIEPIFALAFEHRVKQPDGERVLTFVNETFEWLAKEQGIYSDALMQEIAHRGSLHGIPGLPEDAARVFKTSHEIGYEWHVRHQAAFQRYTDNGVSKTINLPNNATEEDVASAYRLAWQLGCLGITVFRDGCKGEQVLNVGIKKDKAVAPASAGPVVIKPRPHSLSGTTYRTETPIGTAFITVNETPDREPFEVFVQVGKAGSDTMAVAEALGRLISLVLRLPSPLSAQRRLEEVISQLSRIGGGQPTGFGLAKILSLPDAIARTLAEHIGQLKPANDFAAAATGRKTIGDLCKECGQATFIYEEGCKKCLSCGFNEC